MVLNTNLNKFQYEIPKTYTHFIWIHKMAHHSIGDTSSSYKGKTYVKHHGSIILSCLGIFLS